MLIFYHGCWLAIFGHLAQEIQKSTMTLTTFLNSCTPQMMEEIFNQLPGTTVPVTVLVQTLAEFATLYALQFAPRLKNVLSRALPILGGVKDSQRSIYANAITSWCEAISQFQEATQSPSLLGGDMQAMLHSAFDLFLSSWVASRDRKVI
jgi:hypothetical protein